MRFAESFFLAAEVPPKSTKGECIMLKCERYMSHPDNLFCLVVSQHDIGVEIWARRDGWQRQQFSGATARLVLPEFGVDAALGAPYRGTQLA
jgi:hypothetical protein